MSNVNKVLTEGELIVTGRLIDASNATLLAQCTLGQETIKCIYKPVAGERPLWDFPDGNLACGVLSKRVSEGARCSFNYFTRWTFWYRHGAGVDRYRFRD